MTREEFQKKIDSGFDESKINSYYGIMLLMNRAQEQLTLEIGEYLAEFNMHSMNVKHELKGIANRVDALANRIMPTFKDTKDNQIKFFEDYDEFIKLIKAFMVIKPKESDNGE